MNYDDNQKMNNFSFNEIQLCNSLSCTSYFSALWVFVEQNDDVLQQKHTHTHTNTLTKSIVTFMSFEFYLF